jgi:hypothetical protein
LKAIAVALVLLLLVSASPILAIVHVPYAFVFVWIYRRRLRLLDDSLWIREGSRETEIARGEVVEVTVEFGESDRPPNLAKFLVRTGAQGDFNLAAYHFSQRFIQKLGELLKVPADATEKIYRYRKADWYLAILECTCLIALNVCFAVAREKNRNEPSDAPMMLGLGETKAIFSHSVASSAFRPGGPPAALGARGAEPPPVVMRRS